MAHTQDAGLTVAAPTETFDTEPGYVHSVAPDPRRIDPTDNARFREEGCLGIGSEKKYYEFENVFIKRNLTPSEYGINVAGHLVIPYKPMERMKNEAAAIRFIKAHTTIPVPNIRCAFEDRGRYYIITDIVPGVSMKQLPDDKKALVAKELEEYIAQMHAIKSKVIGGFSGDVILPYRFFKVISPGNDSKFREADTPEFVLCHNDLGQSNILVDETTFKINAILDWECAGFFPPEFDRKFYLREGPSFALQGEEDDVPGLLDVLEFWKA